MKNLGSGNALDPNAASSSLAKRYECFIDATRLIEIQPSRWVEFLGIGKVFFIVVEDPRRHRYEGLSPG